MKIVIHFMNQQAPDISASHAKSSSVLLVHWMHIKLITVLSEEMRVRNFTI